jgi:hypothetical protein
VSLGDSVTLTLQLASRAASTQKLAIDYAVHHVKADGGTSPKVFKGWTVTLPARATQQFVKTHSLRPVTTRRYHGGRHVVEVQVNGRIEAAADFVLSVPAGAIAKGEQR